jgi:L,D-transpeptidase YcbB
MNKLYLLLLLVVVYSSCKRNITSISFANVALIDLTLLFDKRIKIDTTLINNYKDETIKRFYENYNNETVWESKKHRDFILSEINSAENEGLLPSDYNYDAIKSFEEKYTSLPDSLLVKYDLLLTFSFQLYVKHLHSGKLNPKEIYEDWDLEEKKIDVNKVIIDGIDNNTFETEIKKLKPQHPIYSQLKFALTLLKKFPNEFAGTIDLRQKILPNKKSKDIPIIKKHLMYWGDMKVKDTILSTLYDLKTQEAIKRFQLRHGLKPDAVIGRSTIDALNNSKEIRVQQVIANLERWRWFAHDFGNHYLLINIPDYSIVVVKENDTVQSQKVVVGKDTRRTPILESKISNINLNPNWTVPPTILKEDIYPLAEKDKGTFRKKGLQIYNSKNEEVNPYSWNRKDAYKYKYVQNPGKNNSLGSMKINFPNKFSVYLHDTNHRNYFSLNYRSLSSGCVRLEKPLEMAAHLLNDTIKWPLKKIIDTTDINHYNRLQQKRQIEIDKKYALLIAKNPTLTTTKKVLPKPILKTIVIKVPNDIYIHQLYWTAWQTKGILQFREDIYCLDAELYSKLRH